MSSPSPANLNLPDASSAEPLIITPAQHESTTEKSDNTAKIVFLGGAAALGILSGFGSAIAMAKKKDPTSFDKGLMGLERMESGGSLALRALGWGSVFAVGGLPSAKNPDARTEFESIRDFFQYINGDDKKGK
ncbi:hypothetical protein BV898_04852 [Hypsibius exemplaris]|uniref:Transmembrane protein 242 n=1 Tax=Hypsibius exemplaris TaxID=2072580 RepID=A0A1W0X0W4_HYPEX|nr:hypothetical protein BV898_04852 [Hypsibius exemplaris]